MRYRLETSCMDSSWKKSGHVFFRGFLSRLGQSFFLIFFLNNLSVFWFKYCPSPWISLLFLILYNTFMYIVQYLLFLVHIPHTPHHPLPQPCYQPTPSSPPSQPPSPRPDPDPPTFFLCTFTITSIRFFVHIHRDPPPTPDRTPVFFLHFHNNFNSSFTSTLTPPPPDRTPSPDFLLHFYNKFNSWSTSILTPPTGPGPPFLHLPHTTPTPNLVTNQPHPPV